jgi:hypothetical protein
MSLLITTLAAGPLGASTPDISHFWPQIGPWVESLDQHFPGKQIKPNFAFWEIGHIVSLFILLGCLILINARLLGKGLITEPASVIYRNVKWWLLLGVVGVIVTGLLIGAANAVRLYASTAFLCKMLSLVAAIIFTYLVTVPVAKADGRVGNLAKVSLVIGLVFWIAAIWIFSDLKGAIAPGLWHLITAGGFIVALATKGKLRWTFLGVLAVWILGYQVLTHTLTNPTLDGGPFSKPLFLGLNVWAARGAALWVVGVGAYQVSRTRIDTPEAAGPLAQFTAYASILVWITVAMGGRWIAFA